MSSYKIGLGSLAFLGLKFATSLSLGQIRLKIVLMTAKFKF